MNTVMRSAILFAGVLCLQMAPARQCGPWSDDDWSIENRNYDQSPNVMIVKFSTSVKGRSGSAGDCVAAFRTDVTPNAVCGLGIVATDGTVGMKLEVAANTPLRFVYWKAVDGMQLAVDTPGSWKVPSGSVVTGTNVGTLTILPKTVTVIFDPDGGTCGTKSKQLKELSDFAALPQATKTGYAFGGWWSEDGKTEFTADSKVPEGGTKLVAHWTANAYVVRFHANNGGDATVDQPFVYGKEQVLRANDFPPLGNYEFYGWGTSATGTRAYSDGQVVSNLVATADGVFNLFALWRPVPDPVSGLIVDGGKVLGWTHKAVTDVVIPENVTEIAEGAFAGGDLTGVVVPATVTRIGWGAFVGCSQLKYVFFEGNAPTFATATGSKTFYAGCAADLVTYVRIGSTGWKDKTAVLPSAWPSGVASGNAAPIRHYLGEADGGRFVELDGNGGVPPAALAVYAAGDVFGELPPATRNGYEFLGWFRFLDDEVPVAKTDVVPPDAEALHAKWYRAVDMMFDGNGGSASETRRPCAEGGSVGALPTASRDGYRFDGWFTGKTDGDPVAETFVVGKSTTFWAHWTPNTYMVHFDANGGGGVMGDQQFTYDKAQALNPNAFANGELYFAGWAMSSDGSAVYADRRSVVNLTAEDGAVVDLYAVWSEKPPVSWTQAQLFYGTYADAKGKTGAVTLTTVKGTEKDGVVSATFTAKVKINGKTYSYKGGKIVDGEVTKLPTSSTKGAPKFSELELGGLGVSGTVGGQSLSGERIEKPVIAGITESANAMVGVRYESKVLVENLYGGIAYSASGLPDGLKINASTGVISGVPTKAKTYSKVKITATSKVSSSYKATKTREIVIAALPKWTQGTFTGKAELGDLKGPVKVTVGSTGKISASIVLGGTNWTYSASGYSVESCVSEEDFFSCGTAKAKVGKKTVEASFDFALLRDQKGDAFEPTMLFAGLTLTDGYADITAWRNPWKDAGGARTLSNLVGAYTWHDGEGGKLKLTVNSSGTVKVAGKLGNGRSLSLSTPLIHRDDGTATVIIHAPAATEKIGGKKIRVPVFFRELTLFDHADMADAGGDLVYRDPCVRASIGPESTGTGSISYSTSLGQGAPGSTVKVTAKAKTGSVLAYWRKQNGDIVGYGSSCSVKLDVVDRTDLIAVFRLKTDYGDNPEPFFIDEDVFANMVVGVQFKTRVEVGLDSYPVTFTAAGLPKGLSINATTGVISGVPTATCRDKAVTVTATSAANKSLKGSVSCRATAVPLPSWAQGTFTGRIELGDLRGSAKVTVGSTGKISASIALGGTNWTCSVVGLSRDSDPDGGGVEASGMAKATIGKKSVTAPFWFGALRASVDGQLEPTWLEGGLTVGDTDAAITAWRNPWKDSSAANVLSALTGSYTWSDGEGGTLKLTVASSGTVKVAGKLGNGRSLSLSVPLIYDAEDRFVRVILYAAAKKEKVGTKTKSYPAFFRELSLVGYASEPEVGSDYVYRDPCVCASADQSSTGTGSFLYSTSLGQGVPGSTVKVTARASSGSVFAYWLRGGEIVGLGTSLSVKLSKNADITDLTAVFRQKGDFTEGILGTPKISLSPVEGFEASGDFGHLSVGVQFRSQVKIDESFYPVRFTATGLPKGLSIDATSGVISGVPTTVCTERKIVITAACVANGSLKDTITIGSVSVVSLPMWAQGTFKGKLDFTSGALEGKSVSCTVSVGKTGKVSGKVVVKSKSYSFSAPGYQMFDEFGYNLGNCTMAVDSSRYEVYFDAYSNGEGGTACSISFKLDDDWVGTELSK